jgi:hypothetical protein
MVPAEPYATLNADLITAIGPVQRRRDAQFHSKSASQSKRVSAPGCLECPVEGDCSRIAPATAENAKSAKPETIPPRNTATRIRNVLPGRASSQGGLPSDRALGTSIAALGEDLADLNINRLRVYAGGGYVEASRGSSL